MKKDKSSGIIVLIILSIFVILFVISSIFIIPASRNSGSSLPFGSQYIGIIHLEGTIEVENKSYNQKWILNTIENLKNDKKNAALIVLINSPGGAVYQTDEVYLSLLDYKATGRKIYIYQGPMAASGGYYISCAGDKIWANRNTLTGSIGVICSQSFDLTEFFKKMGIKSETFYTGKNKNMLNYNEPVTEEQRNIMKNITAECYEQFCTIVSQQRNLSKKDVYKLADGRIYTAAQALSNGLIDNIGPIDNMIYQLKMELNIPNAKTINFVYQRKDSFYDLFVTKSKEYKQSALAAKLGLPENVLEDIENSSNKGIYYLYK